MNTASIDPNGRAPSVAAPKRRFARSIGAVLAGLVSLIALSHLTDALLAPYGLHASADAPNADALFLLALAYRSAYVVLGAWLTATLAPRNPMRHVWVLAAIGVVAAGAGVAANLAMPQISPLWYSLGLLIGALPCAWLGGRLALRRRAQG